ncbi:uncharacterized protein LOC111796017 [Cucurbita pepo subsp. pepo]|uniref:uncharacterized protein LOC111796017 n=1 Tax=Cucurbita pepo subsp. pepo TaxID=3664 RepID=UPI000C9D381A|nr:uncharacterized protein LOC111796017 [Cucurbita pepo subsp. pepo]
MGPLSAGNIIRTAGRAVSRAGVASAGVANRPSSPKSSSRATHRHGGSANFHGLSLSSSLSHSPLSAGWHFCNPYCDEFEWISEDGIETENIARVSEEDANGWSVPSLDEVQGAVSAINQVFGQEKDELGRVGMYTGLVNRASPVGSEVDWIEPCLELQLGARGVERVYDAFQLLQTDPSVQRMVMSVSSDKAVWDAIMNNEAVQQLRKSFYEAKDDTVGNLLESSPDDKGSDEPTNVVVWILKNMKGRVMEVIERMREVMKQMFESGKDDDGDGEKRRGEGRDVFEEKLRTSFLISIVVLLVVMVSRAHT